MELDTALKKNKQCRNGVTMLQTLRKKLIFIFTIATGTILTVVFIVIIFLTEKQMNMGTIEKFNNHIQTITSKILNANSVSLLWISEIESKNRMILHIIDNGVSLTYPGANNYKTDRNILIEQLNSLSLKENIDIKKRPISSPMLASPIFTMNGNAGDRYFGVTAVFPLGKGYRSFLLLQDLSEVSASIVRQRILFFILYCAGQLGLFIASRILVDLSLAPVKEFHSKQIEFIAAASHELRSPLAVIRANNSAMRLDKEHVGHFSAGVESECKRMSRLIDDMLLLASTDAKNWTIKKEPIDVDFLLISSYELYLSYCKEKQISLSLDLPKDTLPQIMGDLQRLQQVLSALLDNAVSYSNTSSAIIIRSYTKKNCLFIEIEDHGIGISDEQKPLVFDRFYRADKARKNKNHFGLGLSIVKELIQLHSGVISIQDSPDGGSTFLIQLPLPS